MLKQYKGKKKKKNVLFLTNPLSLISALQDRDLSWNKQVGGARICKICKIIMSEKILHLQQLIYFSSKQSLIKIKKIE